MVQCGLGAFPAALLHIVGHGCYKAWSFLRSRGPARADAAAHPGRRHGAALGRRWGPRGRPGAGGGGVGHGLLAVALARELGLRRSSRCRSASSGWLLVGRGPGAARPSGRRVAVASASTRRRGPGGFRAVSRAGCSWPGAGATCRSPAGRSPGRRRPCRWPRSRPHRRPRRPAGPRPDGLGTSLPRPRAARVLLRWVADRLVDRVWGRPLGRKVQGA